MTWISLVTDLVMPGGTGIELFRSLVGRQPALRVLFMSGYTGWTSLDRGSLGLGAAFMEKPFSADSLMRQVRAVLDK